MHTVLQLWWLQEGRKKPVRLAQESKSVQLTIKTKQRDTREKVTENGKTTDNPRYNKFYYETFETVEIFDATPAEVKEAVIRGISAAAKK
jgi:hypothetical protein